MYSHSISKDNNTQQKQKQNKTLKIHAVHKQLVTENNIHNFPHRIIVIGKNSQEIERQRESERKKRHETKQEM